MKKYSNLIIIIIFLFIIILLIDTILDKSILGSSSYNSYELQVRAWLNGRTFLDQNYSYLELAEYNGHIFVSFPPFPSLFLLPFVALFQDNIPTNLIMFSVFVMNFAIIYLILKKYRNNEIVSILVSLSLTVGTSLMSLVIDSGVWFVAQLLNNFLCLLAIYAFLNNKKVLVYFFLGLAVGCRPFSIIYLLMFFLYYVFNDKEKSLGKRLINNILPLIPTIMVGMVYMWYNYIRFDNIFEFGHNYLPEFMESEYGQFNIHYLLSNLKDLFFGKISINNKLNITFAMPFSCFIAKIFFSDKDNIFNIVLIMAETIEEYNI